MPQAAAALPSIEKISQELAARFDGSDAQLPVLSTAAQDVLRLATNPEVSGRELAARIEGDPSLCAHVLRVANSPIYGGALLLTSIKQAVGRLGMDLLAQIAASIAIRGSLFSNRQFEVPLHALWRFSLLRGLFAREIARNRRASIETAFLGGLMRDLGQACVFAEIDRNERLWGGLSTETACELATKFGRLAGRCLAVSWNLPLDLALALNWSEDQGDAPPEILQLELGGILAKELEREEAELSELMSVHPASTALGLDPANWTKIVTHRERVLQNADVMS